MSSEIVIKKNLPSEIVIRNCHLTFHVISVILVIIEITVNKVITASILKVVIKDRCVFKKWVLPLPDSHRAVSRIELLRRVDIWRDRCDRRSCKILVSRVNFSENNANCFVILPKNNVIVLVFVTIDACFCCLLTCCVMFQNHYTDCVIFG